MEHTSIFIKNSPNQTTGACNDTAMPHFYHIVAFNSYHSAKPNPDPKPDWKIKLYFVGAVALVVKTLNSGLKGTGFESYQDNVCIFLWAKNFTQIASLHPGEFGYLAVW